MCSAVRSCRKFIGQCKHYSNSEENTHRSASTAHSNTQLSAVTEENDCACLICGWVGSAQSVSYGCVPYSYQRLGGCAASSTSSLRLHCALIHVGTMRSRKQRRSAPVQRRKRSGATGKGHFPGYRSHLCARNCQAGCKNALRRGGTTVCFNCKAEQRGPIVVAGPMCATNA